MNEKHDFASDLRTYLVGFALAALLSAVPFAAVALHRPRAQVLWLLIGCGLVQLLVHFRCFLHIDLSEQKRDDLQLILFSVMIVVLMVGGTLWIMGNAHRHMM
ncbi:cytochrome o ubiquinol oxidase subunit IV [Acetobacteraceae bacterium KSS8]|uniref:Cytochrome bo(3) ubiquinol oxidase subunit 4 n=1 Tax=Endosaccharibacter trunci TaxID=2812733 RepID=A0ABT1W7K9_9PROT|nr:cytochrome o ubiquinol oxidase subunit IV [Acetobacteraceae bacterium KSS8]